MITKLWRDSARHPYAEESWITQATWTGWQADPFGEDDTQSIRGLVIPVPATLHGEIVWNRRTARAIFSLLPWRRDTGIAIAVVATPRDAAVTVLNVAGRADLERLETADRHRKVPVMIATDEEPEISPWIRPEGLADVLAEAARLKPLAESEFTEAIEELRSVLRTSAIFAMVGVQVPMLRTLTLAVSPPLVP